jgi:trehalose/maltose hydrolase-like predicted phosphorylase
VVQGIDKDINEIRTILNKMSETNFESQKTVIICKINDIIEKDGDDTDEHIKTVAKFVLTLRSNKFFAELYAKLYKELSVKFCMFAVVLDDFTNKYKQSKRHHIYQTWITIRSASTRRTTINAALPLCLS